MYILLRRALFSWVLMITSIIVIFSFFLEGRDCCDSFTCWSLPRISYVRGSSILPIYFVLICITFIEINLLGLENNMYQEICFL